MTQPTEIRLSKNKRTLTIQFPQNTLTLAAEKLRVESPSAEVQGHHPSQKKVVTGKENVTITGIEPQGHYAIKLIFSDGHSTGIYTWEYLRELAETATTNP